MSLKHRATVEPPDLSLVKESGAKQTLDQFFRLFKQTSINIFDDLNATRKDHILYFGDEGTNGTWRIVATSTRFSVQLLEAGVWNEKLFASP